MSEPVTCDICGALITDERGGELAVLQGRNEAVWVHPACRGRAPYVPVGDARFAYLSLDDPYRPNLGDWVSLRNVEAQRGRWAGSDGADFEAGLSELIEHGWVEANKDALFRLTPNGRACRGRLGLR
jgi:hypothetical protein